MPDRQLLLLRHAKAVIGDGLEDFDRPLAPRGEKAAEAMGRYMAENGLAPELVLCSPARRTAQTWEIAAQELPETQLHLVEELYDFVSGEALLDVIRSRGDMVKRLLLVTHNPATQNLAVALSGTGDKTLRRDMMEKFPTAALAILTFSSGSWADTAEGQGHLDAFIRPRELG